MLDVFEWDVESYVHMNSPSNVSSTQRNERPSVCVAPAGNESRICFITSSYAISPHGVDKLIAIEEDSLFHFFVFTNFRDDEWNTGGWKKITTNFAYRRLITHSRLGKFFAWKYDVVQNNCCVVFYMDSSVQLHADERIWLNLTSAIFESELGLIQHEHPETRKGIFDEFNAIVKWKKDYGGNINRSVLWLHEQDSFNDSVTIFLNQLFGYNPRCTKFQGVSKAFWERYSMEKDSWRDQPLWAFMLNRHNITPMRFPFPMNNVWSKRKESSLGHNHHHYQSESDVAAPMS